MKFVPMRLIVAAAICVASFHVGCGGDDKKLNYPKPTADGGVGTVTDGKGSQVGLSSPDGNANVAPEAREAYSRGFKAWASGDLAGAKAAFREAAEKDRKSPAPEYSLGVVLEHLGDTAGAQQAFRASFSVQPDYELALTGYAMSLATSGAVSEAETFLTERHAKLPNSPRIATYLGEIKSIKGDHGTAQQLAQDALRLNPDFKEAMVTIARDHYRARKLDLARYAVQAILDGFGESSPARDKDNAEAQLLRGLIERENGRRAVAIAAFEAAAKRRPDLVEAQVQLGAMKLEAGNGQEAQPPLELAVRYGPNYALAHLHLGDCYRLLGQIGEAKKSFERSLALDSSLAVAHYDMGLMYLTAPNVPGLSANDQVAQAITSFEKYKSMRAKESKDDVDDLLNRARAKQNELKGGAPSAPAATGTTAAKPAATAGKK